MASTTVPDYKVQRLRAAARYIQGRRGVANKAIQARALAAWFDWWQCRASSPVWQATVTATATRT